jgi:hypothetical protein
MTHQAICPLRKELRFDGCMRVEPRRVGMVLTAGLCNFGGGGSFRLMASMIGGRWAVPLFRLYLPNN